MGQRFQIVAQMLEHGYKAKDIQKIIGGNIMRVFDQVWVGYHWASYTSFKPLRFAMALTALALVLVLIAILLGG